MNAYTQILEKAASQLNFDFNVCQSDKSEASYLLIACYSNSNLKDVYSCLGVRLANHEAMTANSKNYELQLDNGFEFDYASKTFSTTWGIDEDGDFSTECLEEEMTFSNDEEMIVYMSNCLAVKLQDKI
ncbi:MAG: hypothetical protein JU82_08795 [Sulfuricurvum sp. MLSB]|uniref:hypothetical protein n=1 Tax=Sulfuricurvum sp. MLSB TaxID=1537917 RepID=UPI000506B64F|nr:hypothetical protein [Sulfuricurvum sp. MLSB]KFN39025.1 MAG: hypothetical protein JU82_08795 [Sulfuricurvum sp. MLSB]